jgi:hypothetical protein
MPRPNALHRLRSTSRSTRITAAALAIGGTAVLLASSMIPSSAGTSPVVSASAPVPASAPATGGTVRNVTYDVGATALQVTGFDTAEGRPAGIELAAVVHLPADLGAGPYPLILIQHGFHETCADRPAARAWESAYRDHLRVSNTGGDGTASGRAMDAARSGLLRWPCAAGVDALPNHRGYDDMGEHLAARGHVVVSMSANGISAGPSGGADAARVVLTQRHLAMWRELSQSGTGPLAGAFPGAADLRGAVDLNRVAGIGHVEGIRGFALPGGALSAVVALSPPEAQEGDAPITAPVLALIGSCESGAVAPAGARSITVDGANRTFTNAQWAPAGGQVLGHDDVARNLESFSDVRPRAGWCRNAHDDGAVKQLSETEQRDAVTTHVTTFLRNELAG